MGAVLPGQRLNALVAQRVASASAAQATPKVKKKPRKKQRSEPIPVIAAPPIVPRGMSELAVLSQTMHKAEAERRSRAEGERRRREIVRARRSEIAAARRNDIVETRRREIGDLSLIMSSIPRGR